MLVTLSLVPNIKEVFALPMLLPIALLATASLSTLKRGAANALDWFGLMTFALLAILMWWGWAGLLLDNHAKITPWLKDYQPELRTRSAHRHLRHRDRRHRAVAGTGMARRPLDAPRRRELGGRHHADLDTRA